MSDRPIFVVGCARSGTTMLQLMLDSHPRIAIPPETRFAMGLYRRRAALGDLRVTENVGVAIDHVLRDGSQVVDLALKPRRLARSIRKAPGTVGSVVGTVFAEYAARTGKARWGDKRPNYVRHVPALLEMFPDAQIVHIVRDGRACASSLLSMPWWDHGLIGAAYKWNEAVNLGDQYRSELTTDTYFEVRYETLVSDPSTELERLCAFLQESPAAAMLDFHQDAKIAKWRTWHTAAATPVNTEAVERWRDDLAPEDLAFLEWACGDNLIAQGYELVAPRVAPPQEAQALWHRHCTNRDRVVSRKQAKDERLASRYEYPVAAAITSQQLTAARAAAWYDQFK